jgi:predicted glycosyltransferase
MKIIIDIGHPAHVHLFKYFAREMRTKGHTILFTARDKENEIYLLKKYQFPYKSFGKHYKSTSGKVFGLVKFNLQMLYYSLKFKPDLYLSHGSVYAAMVSWLLRKPHISMEDTGNIEQVRLYLPFTKVVLTSDIFEYEYGKKQIRYNSHHEIAYLHPNYFNTAFLIWFVENYPESFRIMKEKPDYPYNFK